MCRMFYCIMSLCIYFFTFFVKKFEKIKFNLKIISVVIDITYKHVGKFNISPSKKGQ